jgi:hypothetical protein
MQEHGYDVIVLGTGAAGLTAALRAAAGGAQVGLFEKADTVGGTSAWSGGTVWLPNNRHEAELGFSDSREEVLAYLMSLSHGLMEQPLVEAYVDTAPEVAAWLEDNSPVQFETLRGMTGVGIEGPDGPFEAHEAANYNALGNAFHVVDVPRFTYVNHPAWLVLDHHFLSRYGLAGHRPPAPAPDWIIEAPTIAELAERIGVPARALQATVERWNGNIAAGSDPDYHRGDSHHDRAWGDPAFGGTRQGTREPDRSTGLTAHGGRPGRDGHDEGMAGERLTAARPRSARTSAGRSTTARSG